MKKALQYCLFFFLMLVGVAIVVEIVLSIGFSYKDRNIEPMNVVDHPYLYYLFEEGEGLNKHGFKTEHSIQKPDNTFRIILIGGSVARGNAPEQSIAANLERIWQAKDTTGKKIEVINAGISAFVVQQEFILVQSILQEYEPDMIIGLDGYNDMLTWKLNRFQANPHPLPPHNWKDFQVIHHNRFHSKPYSRFAFPFKSINRAKDYTLRTWKAKDYKWPVKGNESTERACETYEKILKDTYDFCEAKGIPYYSFLQPVRFYPSKAKSGEQRSLSDLYANMEKNAGQYPFAFSLTGALSSNLEVFTDDCHVTPEGNTILAQAIFDSLRTASPVQGNFERF